MKNPGIHKELRSFFSYRGFEQCDPKNPIFHAFNIFGGLGIMMAEGHHNPQDILKAPFPGRWSEAKALGEGGWGMGCLVK